MLKNGIAHGKIMEAHRAFEKEIGIKNVRCRFFYLCKRGFIADRKSDMAFMKLYGLSSLLVIAIGGPGGYVISKAWPKYYEIFLFLFFLFLIIFFAIKNEMIIKKCKRVDFYYRPIKIYAKELAIRVKFSDLFKAVAFIAAGISISGYATYVIFQKEYYLIVILLYVFYSTRSLFFDIRVCFVHKNSSITEVRVGFPTKNGHQE